MHNDDVHRGLQVASVSINILPSHLVVYIELKNETFRIDSDKPTLWAQVVTKCSRDKTLAVTDEIRFVVRRSENVDDLAFRLPQ